MKELNEYLNATNEWQTIFGNRRLFFPLDAREILDRIDNDLSPENLHMDGEASPAYVRHRLAFLNKAREQVLKANPKYLEANHG